MSTDEMIACLGSCRARPDIAAMIEALSLHPWLNTPAETKRLEAARAAMENWKSYSHAWLLGDAEQEYRSLRIFSSQFSGDARPSGEQRPGR